MDESGALRVRLFRWEGYGMPGADDRCHFFRSWQDLVRKLEYSCFVLTEMRNILLIMIEFL
jgi:hypothetical protein